jgi:hypothetical protein
MRTYNVVLGGVVRGQVNTAHEHGGIARGRGDDDLLGSASGDVLLRAITKSVRVGGHGGGTYAAVVVKTP